MEIKALEAHSALAGLVLSEEILYNVQYALYGRSRVAQQMQ